MSISSVTPFQPLHPAGLCMPVFSRYACISAWHPSDVSFSKPLASIRTHLGRYTSRNMRSVIRPAQTESNSKPAQKWNESLQKSQARPAGTNPSLFLKTETPKLSKFHLCHNNGSNTECSRALREQLHGGEDWNLLNNIISHLTGGSKNEWIPTQKTFHTINPVSDSLRPLVQVHYCGSVCFPDRLVPHLSGQNDPYGLSKPSIEQTRGKRACV